MTGNTSYAVRQQRHSGADALDDFPTPPWATRALCEKLRGLGEPLHLLTAWDPACNRGHMAMPLAEHFDRVRASDVADYGWPGQEAQCDFLLDWSVYCPTVDWVITNPPFRLAEDFIRMGLSHARIGVAVLVRVAFTEGMGRYCGLFEDLPESFDFPFVERVVMLEGRLWDPERFYWFPSAEGQDPSAGTWKKPSTSSAYTWMVWRHDDKTLPTIKSRIAPCRKRLTRTGDYPDAGRARPPSVGAVPDAGAATLPIGGTP